MPFPLTAKWKHSADKNPQAFTLSESLEKWHVRIFKSPSQQAQKLKFTNFQSLNKRLRVFLHHR